MRKDPGMVFALVIFLLFMLLTIKSPPFQGYKGGPWEAQPPAGFRYVGKILYEKSSCICENGQCFKEKMTCFSPSNYYLWQQMIIENGKINVVFRLIGAESNQMVGRDVYAIWTREGLDIWVNPQVYRPRLYDP